MFRYPGTTTKTVNLASYNYLGFAENSGPCADAAEQAVREYGIAGCSSRHEYGESESERYSFVRERLTADRENHSTFLNRFIIKPGA